MSDKQDREMLAAWAEVSDPFDSFDSFEHILAMKKAALRVLDRLAEAEGVILALREKVRVYEYLGEP